ncbi:MAG: serine protease, partial [Actinomycetia bacterium]|nr:serine protease [Actinomycetes bacterium]
AVIGALALPIGEVEAQHCLDKLSAGEAPTADEWTALDLLVRMMRPAMATARGQAGQLPHYANHDTELVEQWRTFSAHSPQWVPSVGRIDDARGTHVGTGWIAAPGLVVTNRHVASILTYGAMRYVDPGCRVTFGFELGIPDAEDARAQPLVLAAVHDELDLAVLRVPTHRAALTAAMEPVDGGSWVVAVGYPGATEIRALHASVFAGGLGVRRTSPGTVRSRTCSRLTHDCSTAGGSSGSPVLALATGEVVGVHSEGRSAYENAAIPVAAVVDLLGRI